MSGTGGIDIATGQRACEEIHGFRGYDYDTLNVNMYRQMPKAFVLIEECISHNQYRVDLSRTSVIGRIVQGSQRMNDVSVSSSESVSRKHCRFFMLGEYVVVENLSTTTTTLLNDKPILTPSAVTVGDVIGLGDCRLRVLAIKK